MALRKMNKTFVIDGNGGDHPGKNCIIDGYENNSLLGKFILWEMDISISYVFKEKSIYLFNI